MTTRLPLKMLQALSSLSLVGRFINSSGEAQNVPFTGINFDGTKARIPVLINTIYYTAISQTVTISNANPAVLTVTNTRNLPQNGAPVRLTTSGALPTGLQTGTTYWVINASGTTFNLSATRGGSAIATSSAGSGTHTVASAPYEKGINDPSHIDVEVVGAGGSAAAQGNGGTSSFGSHLSCTGGSQGTTGTGAKQAGGLGGAATGADFSIPGGTGGQGAKYSSAPNTATGGDGANTIYGNGGRMVHDFGNSSTQGLPGTGFGSGGGGQGGTSVGSTAGGGGGAGAYGRKKILASALGSSETVTVGQGGNSGLSGANGLVIVREYA